MSECNHTNGTLRAFVELWMTDDGTWSAVGYLVRNTGKPEIVIEEADYALAALSPAADILADVAEEIEEIREAEEVEGE